MSKTKVAPKAPAAQEIPLAGLTITFKRQRDFEGDAEDVTITGAQLGRVLTWMSYAKHVALHDDPEVDLLDARLDLGVAVGLFRLLSRTVEDAAAMLAGKAHGGEEHVVMTIGRPAPVEKQAVA